MWISVKILYLLNVSFYGHRCIPLTKSHSSGGVFVVEVCVVGVNSRWCTRHHGDVIKWKHFPRYWPFAWGIHPLPVNSPHKGLWGGALLFSFICAWINHCVNNHEAGDLRRRRAHYDVIVMSLLGRVAGIKPTTQTKQSHFALPCPHVILVARIAVASTPVTKYTCHFLRETGANRTAPEWCDLLPRWSCDAFKRGICWHYPLQRKWQRYFYTTMIYPYLNRSVCFHWGRQRDEGLASI